MSNLKLKGIYVKLETEDGEIKDVHISDLDREDYEDFLETINKIQMAYISLTQHKE